MNDNNNLNLSNQSANTIATPEVKPVNLSNTAKIEMAPIQNGIVQSSKVMSDNITPVTENKMRLNIPLLLGTFVVVVILVIVLVVLRVGSNSTNVDAVVEAGNMIYSNPNKNDEVSFKITDKLTMEVKITDIKEYEETSLITYDLYVKGSSNKLKSNSVWLDFNKIKIPFNLIGDSLLFIGDEVNDYEGLILNIFNPDGSLITLNEMDTKAKGLYINNYSLTDDSLVLNVTRLSGTDIIYNNRVAICSDDINSVDSTSIVNAKYSYKTKNGVLDLSNPSISESVTLSDYKTNICQ